MTNMARMTRYLDDAYRATTCADMRELCRRMTRLIDKAVRGCAKSWAAIPGVIKEMAVYHEYEAGQLAHWYGIKSINS